MNKEMIPIWVGLITASATLIAVFITNYFNMKSLEKNLRFQFQLKNNELRLSKLENIYELFEQWETYFSIVYLNHLSFHRNKISESELYELMNNHTLISGTFQKMMAVLNINFPELEVEYSKVNLARGEIVKYLKTDNNINVQNFIQAQENFEAVAKNFKKEIALLARNNRTKI